MTISPRNQTKKRTMGKRNYLIEGVSGTGKTSVCQKLRRRGYVAINGDRELAYQGDPTTGEKTEGFGSEAEARHAHHIWDVEKVRMLAANQDDEATFFCGGSRNLKQFTELFDKVFIKRRRQITPGCSRSEDPEDAIEDASVVHPRNATRLVRQHRPYGSPFIVGEFVARDSSPQFGSLNHGSPAKRNASGSAPVRRLRAEADINLPTIPDESVENEPKADVFESPEVAISTRTRVCTTCRIVV
jgi:hypothetical protein